VSGHDCLNFAFEQLRHHWPVQWENEHVNVPVTSRMISNNGTVLRHACLAGQLQCVTCISSRRSCTVVLARRHMTVIARTQLGACRKTAAGKYYASTR
jgi:hypothetical protein